MSPMRYRADAELKKVFIDTGAFYALADVSDRRHQAALKTAAAISKLGLFVFTSDYVVAETHVLLLARLGRQAAGKWLSNLKLHIEYGSSGDLESAGRIISHHSDKNYSLTDALSMAIMRRCGAQDVFGFDSHFTSAGLNLISGEQYVPEE
jgi:predicted nucleic acid-binding protein